MLFLAPFDDVKILKPKTFEDDRGSFSESFNKEWFKEETGIHTQFVQDNEVFSIKNVIRGLHFQQAPFAQAKLVRVLQGKIWDVVVDIRDKSNTFGKWAGIELTNENKLQLYIPEGFAHGYAVLSDKATVLYKCNNYYNPENENGILFNDNTLNIDWKIDIQKALISEKDLQQKTFTTLFQ